MIVPRAFSHQEEFFAAIQEAARHLPPPFVSVTPTLGDDWYGEPAVFLNIVLARDRPIPELAKATHEISFAISQEVQPLEEWGVLPEFSFHVQSEDTEREEPAPA